MTASDTIDVHSPIGKLLSNIYHAFDVLEASTPNNVLHNTVIQYCSFQILLPRQTLRRGDELFTITDWDLRGMNEESSFSELRSSVALKYKRDEGARYM